jgi:dTDP-4-dehydrorhamnose reductase
MSRVVIIGSTGQLGTELSRALREAGNDTIIPLSHAQVECVDPASVRTLLAAAHPEVVVNCAAFIRVDDCEDDPRHALEVNALGALHVARASAEMHALCVYISTDYVFGGEQADPYTEDDAPCPINVYGLTKLAGEYLVRQACPHWLIVRLASLFGKSGARGKGGNFIETVLARAEAGERLRVVDDVRMSPTYAPDAAQALAQLITRRATGLIHLTNQGSCTWYEFARAALALLDIEGAVEPVASREYPTRARRPSNSSLRSLRLPTLLARDGIRPWQEALRGYLAETGRLGASPGSDATGL